MAVATQHYFFRSTEEVSQGIVVFLETTRTKGDWAEIQIGPMDVDLSSMLGVFVRASGPVQLEAFREVAEKAMKDKGIGFAGRPWVAAR